MDPVKSNINSKTCPDPMSSSCITVPVAIPGTSVCSPANLTDVLYQLGTCCNTNSTGNTNQWVDFSTDIPASGSGGGVNWTITNFGFGNVGTTENRPMYKFTKEGDLSLRGSFLFNGTTSLYTSFFTIPLTFIPTTLLPTNFNASQSIMINIACYSQYGNKLIDTFLQSWVTLVYPTGQLILNSGYTAFPGAIFNGIVISFGGSRFNLA